MEKLTEKSLFEDLDNFVDVPDLDNLIQKKQHGQEPKKMALDLLKCEHCPYSTKDLIKLKVHLFKNHQPTEEMDLGTNDEKPDDAKDRKNLVKAKPKKFECGECDFKTNFKNQLKQHVKGKHTPDDDDLLDCEECSFKAKNKTALKKHVAMKHQAAKEIKMLECDFCPFKCKARFILRKHIAKLHKNE